MSEHVATTMRELSARESDGIHVRLLWCERTRKVSVAVRDSRNGEGFSVDVREGDRPLDVFNHPYAYAAFHGVEPSTLSGAALAA